MNISDQKIEQFQQLYLEHFGRQISKEEAYQKGTKLVRLISTLIRPEPLNYNEQRSK